MAVLAVSPFPHLLSPIRLGQHTLRNRVVMGSMHTRLETEPNAPARLAAFYGARARGGAALIVSGGHSPNRAGLMEPGAPLMDDPAAHRLLLDAVHAAGSLMLLQILHAGRYAKHPDLVAPSAIRAPINRATPRAMTDAEIQQTIEDFADCAAAAVAAGYDGIEIMGSEGYLLNQFAARRTNKRVDRWGGSLENRLRLIGAVVARVRQRIGQALLVVRLSAIDLVEDGADAGEVIAAARLVESSGADAINTGIGWHEAQVPTIAYSVPRGAWRSAASRLRQAVKIPVMAANRINTPALADEIIAMGDADMVSLARPMLADPDFVAKAAAGRADEINICIACNQACLDRIFTGRVATCLVNPRACRETEFDDRPASRPRRVAVVGAGAAGLACATTAAERGHQVMLFEAAERIGGQMQLARAVPGKQEFDELLRHFDMLLERTGVELRLHTRPDAAALAGFDVVVMADGVLPRRPEIPGIDHPSVVTYVDVLSGHATVGRRVLVLGAGGVGFDIAETLSGGTEDVTSQAAFDREWGVDPSLEASGGVAEPALPTPGREVTVLQRSTGRPGARLGISTGWILRRRLQRRGVKFLTGVSYLAIDDAGLHYLLDGTPQTLPADTIVLCTGHDSATHDPATIQAELHVIGGARLATELDAQRAIDEGTRLGCRL